MDTMVTPCCGRLQVVSFIYRCGHNTLLLQVSLLDSNVLCDQRGATIAALCISDGFGAVTAITNVVITLVITTLVLITNVVISVV